MKSTPIHYYRTGHSKRAITNGSKRTGGDASSLPDPVGTDGDVHHHRQLVTRTGGDEVADHHRRFQPRAGGDEKHHHQFLLRTGGDEVVQYKIPTPSSSRPQIYPTAVPTARRLLGPSRLSLQLPPSPTVVADPARRLRSQAQPPRSCRRHGCAAGRRACEGPCSGSVAAAASRLRA